MSILLIVMSLLAIFHLFYQSVILKTNNQLFETDMEILKHELDIFEIKNSKTLNSSEIEFLKEVKRYVKICPAIGKNFTALEFIMDMIDYKSSNSYESEVKEIRSLKVQNEPLWNYMVDTSKFLIRNMTSNASLFLFVLSPILFLVLLYSFISGKTLSIQQSVERISSKHC